jgi:hypothetical protein
MGTFTRFKVRQFQMHLLCKMEKYLDKIFFLTRAEIFLGEKNIAGR